MSTAGGNTIERRNLPVRLQLWVVDSIAGIGAAILHFIELVGGFVLFVLADLVLDLLPATAAIDAVAEFSRNRRPQPAGRGADRDVHRHGAGGAEYAQFRAIGFETRLGAVINMSLVRELGPVLAATMLAGRVGSAMAAELGTMRVTEQIDALASMGANPIHYLVVPRFLGCLLLIPSLTVMADFMGVVRRLLLLRHGLLDIDCLHYWSQSREYVDVFDCLTGSSRASSSAPRLPW